MPTVAPMPKVRSGLPLRRSHGSGREHRGPQKSASSVDAWRLIGRGRHRFPTLPRQLHDLTSPCDMQGKPSLPTIVGDAGGPSLAINGEGAGAPVAHLFLACLLLCSIACSVIDGATKEVLCCRERKGPSRGPRLPGAQARPRPPVKGCRDPHRDPFSRQRHGTRSGSSQPWRSS